MRFAGASPDCRDPLPRVAPSRSHAVRRLLLVQGDRVPPRASWLYLDADGFFASCEEAADPRLHGRPVGVVAGSAYADAPLIAVNTVAKRAGVRSGDRVRDARDLCPAFVVRPQCVERYVAIHDRMVCAVGAVLPVAAVHSIDEISARLSPRDDPPSVVDRVKRSVARTGRGLSCIVRCAPMRCGLGKVVLQVSMLRDLLRNTRCFSELWRVNRGSAISCRSPPLALCLAIQRIAVCSRAGRGRWRSRYR